MALPDVRAWTPAAKTASSLESLRLISDDCAAKGNMFFFFLNQTRMIHSVIVLNFIQNVCKQ